jgi:hypothetical protein
MKLKEILTEESANQQSLNYNQAMKTIQQIAPYIKRSGAPVDGNSLSSIFNTTPTYAEKILQWGINKGKIKPDTLGQPIENNPVFKLVVDAFKVKNNGGGMGLQRVSQRTGLSPDQIKSIVTDNWDDLYSNAQQLGINLKPAFYGDVADNKGSSYDKGKESLENAIRRVMMDLTDNLSPRFAASISAYEIADELGVARTTVDRELSNNPKLRDLEAFRKLGKRPGMTDQDKADRFHRMQHGTR